MNFGQLLKKHRTSLQKSLRQFCLENGFDPGNFSKLERGVFAPPQNPELIEKYALALEIQEGSDDWLELFDAASIGNGDIPADIAEDDSLIERLPVLFRTIRSKKISGEDLDKLVDEIRKS